MKVFVWINKPWLHFLVLGVVFYQLQAVLFPEPKPVIGPLSEARVASMKALWQTSAGREPTTGQLAGFVAAELDRSMLLQRALDLEFHLSDSIVYQRLIRNMNFLQLAEGKSDVEQFEQALDMRLHLDDEVVKRRLVQMMEQRLLAANPPAKPTEDEIQAAFEQRRAELKRPPQYSFEHVFLNLDREAEVLAIGHDIRERKLDVQNARKLGSPFIQGYRFLNQTPDHLARNFGRHFVQRLELAYKESKMSIPGWLGPVPSAYGFHYVWLSDFEPARDAEFGEVRQQILTDLEYSASKHALQCAIADLRSEYVIQGRELVEEDCD